MAAPIITRGSIVLVRYPFTDLSGSKLRPAAIVTPDDLLGVLEDALCAFITTVIPDQTLPTDLIIQKHIPEFSETGLKETCMIRAHKLALLHRSLVMRNLGMLGTNLMAQLDKCLIKAVGANS